MSSVYQTVIIPVNEFFALKYLEYIKYPNGIRNLSSVHQAILNAGYTHVIASYELDRSMHALREGTQITLDGLYRLENSTVFAYMQSKLT